MTQDTQSKFAAILAAAQQKANDQVKPTFAPLPEVKPDPIPEPEQPQEPVKLAKLVCFTIVWHEGSGKFDGSSYNNWWGANTALRRIAREHDVNEPGYTKVKVNIKWENGQEITDRLDVCLNDFWPLRESIGDYLKGSTSVMYESNLQKGDRVNLQWEDDLSDQDPEPAEPLTQDEEAQISSVLSEIIPQIPEQKEQPKQSENGFKITEYNERSFAIYTSEKPSEETLNIFRLYGSYNSRLKGGKGWIFSKRHLDTLKNKLGI